MKRLALGLLLFALPLLLAGAPASPLETEVGVLVAKPTVTVVHFWAPWCPNCAAEMTPDGWARFIAANPSVQFVFLNVWHRGLDPAPKLRAAGLGDQANLLLRTDPNPSSRDAGKLGLFLGLPVTWLPTTWIFRDGRLRFALNYGEIHFPMLQTLVDDTRDKAKWAR
jgi:thiol-disulfide isomerase/thioredoxin